MLPVRLRFIIATIAHAINWRMARRSAEACRLRSAAIHGEQGEALIDEPTESDCVEHVDPATRFDEANESRALTGESHADNLFSSWTAFRTPSKAF
jgi:hypothetical protein